MSALLIFVSLALAGVMLWLATLGAFRLWLVLRRGPRSPFVTRLGTGREVLCDQDDT